MKSTKFLAIALLCTAFSPLRSAAQAALPQMNVKAPLATSSTSSSTVIGYVKLERIMTPDKLDESTQEWRDRVKELQTDLETRYSKIATEQQKFEKARADLESPEKNKWSSDASREEQAKDLSRMETEITTEVRYLQKYRDRATQALQAETFAKIEKATQELAPLKGIDLVLYAGGLYVSKKIDITDDVITLLNSQYEGLKKSKPTATSEATAPALAKR